jgi:hypothetical protein
VPVAGVLVQGDRLGQGAVRVEVDLAIAEVVRRVLQGGEHPSSESATAPGVVDPHPLDLGAGGSEAADPTASRHRPFHAGHEEAAVGRVHR